MIYEPAEDSFLLQKHVRKYAKNKLVLDMGAGSGIQSLTALESNAKKVLAVDIDKEAISHLRTLNIPCKKSNLFKNIKGRYDLILFNPPYLPEDFNEDSESALITCGGKDGDEKIIEFLKQSKKHLKKEGIILLILSSITPINEIKKLTKKLKYTLKKIDSIKLFMEEVSLYKITNN
jgi:release factor glutamine methyltransferase